MTEVAPKPRRRFLRFSLRTLLLLAVAVALPLAWPGRELEHARQEWLAVTALENAGCRVTYGINQSPTVLDRLLELLPGKDHQPLFVVCVQPETSQITDRDLMHLRALSTLQQLSLEGMQVTDAGMRHLQRLAHLEYLFLNETRITDEGLSHLRWMDHLECLDLAGTEVTDRGLVYLRGLTNLRVLNIKDTNVTEDGVTALRDALPNLQIE